jgi:hypothetical protein
VARGGAPVWLSVPPWHVVQVVRQVAPWQTAQEMETDPPTPSRFAPWQGWQLASARFAAYAWKVELAWSIQAASWPPGRRPPQGWQAAQEMLFEA